MIEADAGSIRAGRFRRHGWGLFFVGWVLIGLSFFLEAALSYEFLATPPSYSSFNQLELYSAVEGIFVAVGVLMVGIGWVLSWPPTSQLVGAPGLPAPRSRSVLSWGLLFVGVSSIAGCSLYLSFLAFSTYYQVQWNLWQWTEPTLEIIEGLGVVFAALGWLVHRADERSGAAMPAL